MSTKYLNADASEWVGIGGAGNDSGYLIQTGTDEIIGSSSQSITYTGWVEAFGLHDHTLTWTLTSAICTDPVTAEVTSNFDSDGYDYYMIDVANLNFSHIEYWPTSDGSTGECLVGNPKLTQYPNFTDFNYITFTGCDINSTPIGDLTHDYYNMYDGSRYMATTGGISNGGTYTVTWKNPTWPAGREDLVFEGRVLLVMILATKKTQEKRHISRFSCADTFIRVPHNDSCSVASQRVLFNVDAKNISIFYPRWSIGT